MGENSSDRVTLIPRQAGRHLLRVEGWRTISQDNNRANKVCDGNFTYVADK
jgi:hypothetical protein